MFGELYHHLYRGQRIVQPVFSLRNARLELTHKLSVGSIERTGRIRAYNIHDSLRFGKVHLAVDESCLRELARSRRTDPERVQNAQDLLSDSLAAVTGDLDHIFACI